MKSLIQKHLAIAIVSFLIVIISIVVFWRFSKGMKEKEVRVIDARDRLASFEENKRTFSQEAKELEKIKDRIEQLEGNVVTEASVPELLSSLESMASTHYIDFTITSVDSGASKEEGKGALHIDFSASGALSDLEHFSHTILSQAYQARFNRFSLYLQEEGGKGKAGSWELLAGVDILSF